MFELLTLEKLEEMINTLPCSQEKIQDKYRNDHIDLNLMNLGKKPLKRKDEENKKYIFGPEIIKRIKREAGLKTSTIKTMMIDGEEYIFIPDKRIAREVRNG